MAKADYILIAVLILGLALVRLELYRPLPSAPHERAGPALRSGGISSGTAAQATRGRG